MKWPQPWPSVPSIHLEKLAFTWMKLKVMKVKSSKYLLHFMPLIF